jgi:hypothetical protein
MSTSSIMHHHSTPYAAAAAVVVAAAAVVSLSSLSLSGSDQPNTNIAPPSSPSIGAQFNHPPVGGGHLTGG